MRRAAGRRWVVAGLVALAALATTLPAAAAPLQAVAPPGAHYVRGGVTPPLGPWAVTWDDGRTVHETAFVAYADAGAVTLVHPAAVVERIGLHQSNHEGARDQVLAASAAGGIVLGSRGRLSGLQSAADVVVAPGSEIRAPVTGTVVRAGTYELYCRFDDDYAVIAPDDEPAWEVKLLHIQGLAVQAGDRVVAGETVLAAAARPLPFRSQVDDTTAEPSWPHVHVEVIDPSIPNVPNGGSGGC